MSEGKDRRCVIKQDSINRRDFLKKTAVVSAGVVMGGRMNLSAAAGRPVLASISGASVEKHAEQAIEKILKPFGGMQAFVKKGQSVLIKPNMGFPTPPEQRANTSPRLIAAVVKHVIRCGASKVLVIDNPVRRPEACLRVNGIQSVLSDLDVHLLMPTSEKAYVETDIPKGKSLKRTKILKEALHIDVHIAMPVAKSHNAAGFSGGLKGMMGLILDRESFHSRYDLNQAIADLNTVLRPNLIVMDGISVMSTDGPAGPGKLISCNTIVAGLDPVAVDAAGVNLAPLYGRKIKPQQIKHIKKAVEHGLGVYTPADDQVVKLTL